jgi:uncharacterized protein DUF5938/saccharopine dehydrogenase-like protein
MSSQKPVVVYGASGYTGRLACESLTELRVPFVVAGRNLLRLEEVAGAMRARGADCVAQAAEHTPRGLRELLRGAKAVINISGPFSLLGHAVVDAALVEGCHYLDSTGEQDFMLDVRREYGPAFEAAKLVLSPSAAFLWAFGSVAAEVCIETPGIDSIEVVYAPPSLQTIASLQSMIRSARRSGYGLADGKLSLLPPADLRRVPVPGQKARRAMRVGAGEATFLLGDPRVRTCDTWFANDTLGRVAPWFGQWNRLSKVVPGDRLDEWSDALVLKFKKNPPPEDPESSRFIVAVHGKGAGGDIRAILSGTAAYALTGYVCAFAAQALLEGRAARFGYVSLGQTLGTPYVLKRLEEGGTTATFERTETASAPARRPIAVSASAGA